MMDARRPMFNVYEDQLPKFVIYECKAGFHFQFVREDHLDRRVARKLVIVSMATHATLSLGLVRMGVAMDGKETVATHQVLHLYCCTHASASEYLSYQTERFFVNKPIYLLNLSIYQWYAPHPVFPHNFEIHSLFEGITPSCIRSLYKVLS